MDLFSNGVLSLVPDIDDRTKKSFATRNIKKSLIQRQWFDKRRKSMKDVANLSRYLCVVIKATRQKDGARTQPFGGHRGHSTVDAELAGHVVCRCHDATFFRVAAHDNRFAPKFRSIPLFDRGVEGVHVDVEDH